jgi:sialic acid synthase SpsE
MQAFTGPEWADPLCEHVFVSAPGHAYGRFRRALDRGNVTEALSAAAELQFVALAEALELTLLLADEDPQRYERAAVRWHARFLHETKNVDLRESLAVLALLAAIPANRLAATALAELLGRRASCERITKALVRWSRAV